MFPYRYTIVDISEGDEKGYKAILPAFPHLYIVAESVAELDSVVRTLIEEEILELGKQGIPPPHPDSAPRSTGNFTIRIQPALHRRIAELAQAKGSSLNRFIAEALEKSLSA